MDDGLPKHICLNCHNDLVNYNKFRLLCTASDAYFRQNVKIKATLTNEEKNVEVDEFVEDVESDSEDCDVNEQSKGQLSNLLFIKTKISNLLLIRSGHGVLDKLLTFSFRGATL